MGLQEPLLSLCDPQILCDLHLGIMATEEFKVAMVVKWSMAFRNHLRAHESSWDPLRGLHIIF